ncbi:hypothetical protein B0H14DRAFT_2566188 [Mycena olivaceomarginata]|nr:hypothetical protein B0H14DRAFT_2566188 [Mycena olivaceomarginata]
MSSSTTGVAGAEEAYESHPARPVTIGMGTGAGAGMPPSARIGCGWWVRKRKPFRHVERVARDARSPRCASPFLCDFSYSTPPSLLTPRCIFCVTPTSCPVSPSSSAPIFHRLHHIDLVPLCFPSPVSRFLDAGSVIPVAPIPAARISTDLRLRSPPRAVPRQESPSHLRLQHSFCGVQHESGRTRNGQRIARFSCPRGPGWRGHTRRFSRAYIGAGEADLHASGAGSGIGLHRIRRPEWEGRLVRRTSCRRLAGARGWVRQSAESVPHIGPSGGVRAAGQTRRRRAEGTARHRQTSASHLRGGVPVCAREAIMRRRRKERGRRDDAGACSLDADARRTRACGPGWRRGKRSGGGGGRRRGRAVHVSPDAPPPAHRIGRVVGGEGGGGEMMDGDGDEESTHDVRRPAAPHTPPVACAEREGHRWGGRSVGSHRCSGWGRQERAQARDLGVLCAHLPLRPLRPHPFIFPPGRGSAPSASITHHDRREHPTIHRCDSDGARAAPASPRYEGEDAGYGEGDEDGDGVGSDVGGALKEAYPHEGDAEKTVEITPTSDVCAHVECARARDVERGLPHEQQAQVVPHGRSPLRLVPRLPAFYVLLVRLDLFVLRTHQVTFSYSHVLLVSSAFESI